MFSVLALPAQRDLDAEKTRIAALWRQRKRQALYGEKEAQIRIMLRELREMEESTHVGLSR